MNNEGASPSVKPAASVSVVGVTPFPATDGLCSTCNGAKSVKPDGIGQGSPTVVPCPDCVKA